MASCFTIHKKKAVIGTFFFYRYRYHRYLHSFPTRRSSDLAYRPRGSAFAGTSSSRSSASCPHRAERAAKRDRKSTRLNSSHVSISYAVFCLKKKKHEGHRNVRP